MHMVYTNYAYVSHGLAYSHVEGAILVLASVQTHFEMDGGREFCLKSEFKLQPALIASSKSFL